jgi:hypothetical protein
MHMQGRPETWVQRVVREGMGWNKLLNEGFDRFDQEGEWKLLKEWSDVEKYHPVTRPGLEERDELELLRCKERRRTFKYCLVYIRYL